MSALPQARSPWDLPDPRQTHKKKHAAPPTGAACSSVGMNPEEKKPKAKRYRKSVSQAQREKNQAQAK
jgi:hypothetical protein